MLAITITFSSFVLALTIYNAVFKKHLFRNELSNIRREKILSKNKQQINKNVLISFTPSTPELINYLNKIINDNNTEIVKKYFYNYPFL
tara:strand:- start:966 stop:1232 length:267 start_codon:yes stop_codon:yes gene_type:complete